MTDFNEKCSPKKLEAPEPSAELGRRIMHRIDATKSRALMFKVLGFGFLFLTSLSLIIVGSINLLSALAQSGFFSFASLFFSDFSDAVANFQDFAYSIIESFPVFSAAFFFAGVGFSLWSASHLLEDVSRLRLRSLLLSH